MLTKINMIRETLRTSLLNAQDSGHPIERDAVGYYLDKNSNSYKYTDPTSPVDIIAAYMVGKTRFSGIIGYTGFFAESFKITKEEANWINVGFTNKPYEAREFIQSKITIDLRLPYYVIGAHLALEFIEKKDFDLFVELPAWYKYLP